MDKRLRLWRNWQRSVLTSHVDSFQIRVKFPFWIMIRIRMRILMQEGNIGEKNVNIYDTGYRYIIIK